MNKILCILFFIFIVGCNDKQSFQDVDGFLKIEDVTNDTFTISFLNKYDETVKVPAANPDLPCLRVEAWRNEEWTIDGTSCMAKTQYKVAAHQKITYTKSLKKADNTPYRFVVIFQKDNSKEYHRAVVEI